MANPVLPQRLSAKIEGDFVVFLIGMRVNAWWKPHKWLPPMRAMLAMQRELRRLGPEQSGCLHTMQASPGLTVQYWRSFDHLEAYATAKDKQHMPAWSAFTRAAKNSRGDVGIWHEPYLVRAGEHESLYSGMPLHGLGAAADVVPATGPMARARGRLGR